MALPLVPVLTQFVRTIAPIVAKQFIKKTAKQGTKQLAKKAVQQTARQTGKQVVKGPKNSVGGNSVKKMDSFQKEDNDSLSDSITKGLQKKYQQNQEIIHGQNSQIGKYTNYTRTYGNMPKKNIFPR